MNKCTLTIVIPTLNEELYLPLLLSDLEKQSNNDFAIIIVDAVSQDTTIKKCKDFSKTLNISIIEVEKQNVSFQKNTGAQKATSSHIIFLDADMRVKKNIYFSSSKSSKQRPHSSPFASCRTYWKNQCWYDNFSTFKSLNRTISIYRKTASFFWMYDFWT